MGVGNGPIAAFINAIAAIDINVSVMDYVEHTMTASTGRHGRPPTWSARSAMRRTPR